MTERQIQQSFAKRCEELLGVMVEQTQKEETWDLYLAKGAGDRAIAGDHEERHLLELLQNARDAIYRGREAKERIDAPGRVFVAVTEQGMAMANTGDPFRLNDKEVLKAVRFLQRSDKVSRGFIGHKGVGLKSILLRAGAFSVRSHINGDMLRATFSRSRTADRLLDHLDQDDHSLPTEQARYIRQQLPRLPLFTQPHADSASDESLDEDAWLIEALLEGTKTSEIGLNSDGKLAALPTYTTVVYLPYQDERWETLLEETEARLSSAENDLQTFKQAKQQSGLTSSHADAGDVWNELTNLDRRMLVLLGEIGELQLARFEAGNLQEARRIDIERPLSPLNGDREARPRRVTMREQRWTSEDKFDDETEHTFVVLSSPTKLGVVDEEASADDKEQEPREHIRILLEIPDSDHTLQNEPLFLYYPIETERSGLPFLIHGPFRVNSSRTALVKNQEAHNRAVLDEAVELLEDQLSALLDESQEIRRWLPWILLPLLDPEADGPAEGSRLQIGLCKDVIELLRNEDSVPTTASLARPEEVHFFPERPDALLVLEDVGKVGDDQGASLKLLDPANHKSYKVLYEVNGDRLSQAARRIVLGEIDLETFAEALSNYLGQKGENLYVDEERAKKFFLNLCDLFSEADNKVAKEAAETMGQRVPLLPAFAGNAADQDGKLKLVPTEARGLTQSEKLQKASRVVFWRPASVESRVDDLPIPPASIPVYFMAPSVIKAEGARAEGILSTFYDEWGTTRFESRPDLFRRVADRAGSLPEDKPILPVLGYLSRMLYRITSESYAGADDLQPRPYAAIDLATLRKAVHRYGSSSRRQYWERLESLQRWSQIRVPVQGERKFAPANAAVFGPAWAQALREFVAQMTKDDMDDEEAFLSEEGWAEAIDNLTAFRETMGRSGDDNQYPAIAPPDDKQWEPIRERLRREESLSSTGEESKAIFDLLLLLGVRIGPRVEWRWLDTRKGADRFDEPHRALNRHTSRALFKGEDLEEESPAGIRQMARSELTRAYCDHITMKPYHTVFSGGHSYGCRKSLSRAGDGGSALAAWIWFPDLRDDLPLTPPFDGQQSTVDAFREALVSIWSSLSERVLQTGWYCCRGWHQGRHWKNPIPSLAAFQLVQFSLWPSRADTHLPDSERHRFPASAMVAWQKKEAPSANDAARFFPLLDTREEVWANIAQDLQVNPLSGLSFYGAVSRLRWLLEQSRTGDDAPEECWAISEFGDATRNAWLRAQYQLLARIVEEDVEDIWSKRTVRIGGFALRAVRDENQIAVPVVNGKDREPRFPQTLNLAFFSQSPRYWEKEEHADKWILTASSQLQTKLYRWAEALGAERIPPSDPPAYTGKHVDAPEAVKDLRQEVRRRLSLLLGVFKAHQAEKLDEMVKTVLDAMDTLQAVEPDRPDEAGSSGLDGEGRLVFSHPAYQKTGERSQAVVLAEGIALLVNQTTAVGDLQNALGAPPCQVELALHFRGIDLDEIINSVSALARERLISLTERIEGLVRALSQATGTLPPPIIDWKIDVSQEQGWMEKVEALEALEGPTAKRALDAIETTVPDLPPEVHEDLLRQTIDEGLTEHTGIRNLLTTLQDAGWSLERRKAFTKSGMFEGNLNLKDQRELIGQALDAAIIVALIAQLRTGEMDGVEDPLHELENQARSLRDLITVRATESDVDFIQHLRDNLKIAVPFESPDRLLIEWGEGTWDRLIQALREAGDESLREMDDQTPSEIPEEVWSVLKRCLAEESLAPLQESRDRKWGEGQRRISKLERDIGQGTLSFDPTELKPESPALERVTPNTSRPGERSGGPIAGVTSDQAVRGRVAELFVLQACWVRFLDLEKGEARRQVLEAIIARREHGSTDTDEHVRWSTKTAWRDLEKRLERRREVLIECSQDPAEASDDLAKMFKALIEVANERGPGYDVLDPFGVWGTEQEDAPPDPDPRRVEVKAVPADTTESAAYRVVLTTNEFHRASHDSDSYVLRLVAVPRKPEQNLKRVKWICDIPDPVQELSLAEQIRKGVRGGTLPLKLQIDEQHE